MDKKDYSTVCWYCGKAKMQNRGDCYQCTACGATWNKVPKLAFQQIERGSSDVITPHGTVHVHGHHLAPAAVNKALKAKRPKSECV